MVEKYGSVVASVYEGGTADGMNEKGLAANLLYLAESEYAAADDKRPGICITACRLNICWTTSTRWMLP